MTRVGAKDPSAHTGAWGFVAISVVMVPLAVASIGAWIALWVSGAEAGSNPFATGFELAAGRLQWSGWATAVAVVEAAAVAAAAAAALRWWSRRQAKTTRVDAGAKYLGQLKDVKSLTESACRAKAEDLAVKLAPGDLPGVPIGDHIPSGAPLFGSYEDMHTDIAGPRVGKSTTRVIPAVLRAPGPVVTTSNKRDVVDATRAWREEKTKNAAWVFDPQGVVGEPPRWFWNPLSWVTDEVRAAEMAGHFAKSEAGEDARGDAFFEPEGEDLLASLFLCAAVGKEPITKVYEWVSDMQDRRPVAILESSGKFAMTAASLKSHYNAAEKQKSGVFATARKMARVLKLEHIRPWVVDDGSGRPEFDPAEFVRSQGTLYALSLEGVASGGPLVTALTDAVLQSAVKYATGCAGGRLPVPMVCPLDEVANVVRWRDLPQLYSHFGSRGIVVMSFLQSWSQGEQLWGEKGMSKLWGASNIRMYLGGASIDDGQFLPNMSKAVGEYSRRRTSVSLGERRTANVSVAEERIFHEWDLEALPRGRALVRSSGNRPVLVATKPWYEDPIAEEVAAANRRWKANQRVSLVKEGK
ncbi:type IV secretory system conjugative DNA transfer family protein [Nocardia asteroides]|uniref:type IV secretory system conjugative DNA transfer family protein n=1 Tax=Nocardia asteroides TaxID=1824 RepID=UPI001E64CF6C|nr:TraM recognition domain-containing protein [Nocardia asteroides]UGT58889.1 TraM recognition domain-containing protein [Nocardia asteroides]